MVGGFSRDSAGYAVNLAHVQTRLMRMNFFQKKLGIMTDNR